ncbi:MAG: DUF4389 domain-containing protein [Gaiellaceae bacterium]
METAGHPVRLVVRDDLRRSRLTVLLRLVLALPHLVWLSLWSISVLLAALASSVAVVATGRTPDGLRRFLSAFVRYATHVNAYLFLAANRFPGFFGRPGYAVDVELSPPGKQSRLSAALRLFLGLPALAIAALLGAATGQSAGGLIVLAAFLGWFVALALGRMPLGLRDLVVYAIGYAAQTLAYLLLLTPRYPDSHPDRLLPDAEAPRHPVRLRVEDGLRRSRLAVLFRPLLVFPHLAWLWLWSLPAAAALLLAWLWTLAAGCSPRSLHRFLAAYVRCWSHVASFLFLVGGPFPGFAGRQGSYPVEIEIDPPARQRRLVTLFRLPLILPALLIAGGLSGVVVVVGVFGWFAALATGRMPAGLRSLGAAAIRYLTQTHAYGSLLTDRYPHATPTIRTARTCTPEAP